MRIFSYRNKRRIRTGLIALCILLAALALLILCRFIFVQRFLVYADSEVKLNYQQDLQSQQFPADQQTQDFPLEIEEQDSQSAASLLDQSSAPMTGYYISTKMLQNVDDVKLALDALDETPTAISFEMKSIYGNFYYESDVHGAVTANCDTDAIEALIQRFRARGTYLIARIPAFTDNNFALDNQASGLPLRSGALWMDDNNCYWLDPLSENVQSYLVDIAMELADMGFDELVFEGFTMPDSQNIVYDTGELTREEVAGEAAKQLRMVLDSLDVKISFGSENATVAEHTDRVYLSTDNGASVAALVDAVAPHLSDPKTQIVFQTASRDTRFDDYGILRPLIEYSSNE